MGVYGGGRGRGEGQRGEGEGGQRGKGEGESSLGNYTSGSGPPPPLGHIGVDSSERSGNNSFPSILLLSLQWSKHYDSHRWP